MPDGFSPGSREWSGSAVLGEDRQSLSLYFTATGRRGEAEPGFLQRLFVARASLNGSPGAYRVGDWREVEEIVQADPSLYMATDTECGGPGTIKAFRDPAYFRDPRSGARYLFFAGSAAGSSSAFNGVIGAAVSVGEARWRLLPPMVSADGLNNELERPHVVWHGGLYYLFWSTQRQVFDPAGPVGPTGLYGMVSKRLDGGWVPLNGTGLVFANPPRAPAQAYSWLVLPDLRVTSFVDDWGVSDGDRSRRFGGSFAPWLRLELAGHDARLVG
jgi:levansucrase